MNGQVHADSGSLPGGQEVREFSHYYCRLLLQGKFQAFRGKNLDCLGHCLGHFKMLSQQKKSLEKRMNGTLRVGDARGVALQNHHTIESVAMKCNGRAEVETPGDISLPRLAQ